MKNPFKNHYHWVIAAVALLQLLIYGGAVNNFTSYHVVPVTEALDISRTAFSLAGSFRGVVGVLSTLLTGNLIQKLGYRKTVSIGLGASAAAYLLFSFMRAYWMLALGCGMIGLASGICATSGVSRLLNLWFHKYRGTVLGIVSAATGIGSTLLGLIQAYAIDNVSWRLSFLIVAGLQALTALVVFLLVRNSPEDLGLKPLGWGQAIKTKKKTPQWEGFTMAQLKKRPIYYMLACFALLSVLSVISSSYNLVPYFQECGMSATEASKLYGIMMLVLGGVKLLMGVLCDIITTKRVTLLCHVACTAGLLMVLLLPKSNYWAMICSLIVFDFCMPITTLIFPLLSVELFGYQANNQYIGLIMAMTSAASIISGPIASAIFDVAGSYVPVFVAAAALSLGTLAIYPVLYALAKRDRRLLCPEENAQCQAQ